MKRKFIVITCVVGLLLGAVVVTSVLVGGSDEAEASPAPKGFEFVKSRFLVPSNMSDQAQGGDVISPESVPGYSILRFNWGRPSGKSKGTCVSVDSGKFSEIGPYCFAPRQVVDCNALISLKRGVGDYVTFGLVSPTLNSVSVRSNDRSEKLVPAKDGLFVTLTRTQVDACQL